MSVNCCPRVPTLILCITSWIPHLPNLVPGLPTLSPLVTLIPLISLIPFPDFPFRLLQVAILNDSDICEVKQTFKKYI